MYYASHCFCLHDPKIFTGLDRAILGVATLPLYFLYHFVIEPIRPRFNGIRQRWWFAEVIIRLVHQSGRTQVKLVRTLDSTLSSWSRSLKEEIKPRRGVVAILLWHAFYSKSTPFFFFLRWPKSTTPYLPSVLIILLATKHSLNGDYPFIRT